MTDTVKITAFEIKNDGRTNRLGLTPIAFFSCDLRGIRVKGCQLMRSDSGLVVWLPTLKSANGNEPHKSVTILDIALRDALRDAALAAYRSLGGSE